MSGNYPNGVLHPACGKRFADTPYTGHCSGCCETFVGLQAFDEHRRGGKCTRPDAAAGPWSTRADGAWRWNYRPMSTAAIDRLLAAR